MDALFGLPRKKAGRFELPLHGDIFFCDQNEVNEFVYQHACLSAI